MKGKNSFWSSPYTASVIDIISILFSLFYFVIIIAIIYNPEKNNLLELQSNMNIPMGAIIGGYFGDQISHRITAKRKEGEFIE